jgi:hypothetical protein
MGETHVRAPLADWDVSTRRSFQYSTVWYPADDDSSKCPIWIIVATIRGATTSRDLAAAGCRTFRKG